VNLRGEQYCTVLKDGGDHNSRVEAFGPMPVAYREVQVEGALP
jgi:hypothetical protein